MTSFEDTLSRMKSLYSYGKGLNENKTINSYTLEHKATGADGKTYGIIRECNKYYIKVAQPGKEHLAEGYNYLGGFCNKGNYEYESYNKAFKNFELKMSSINEACEGNAITSTLDPFKKGDFLVEATERMKDTIARQRQIMYNVSMLMNEATEIGASRKDDVVMYDGKNPEAKTGKRGDEEFKETKAVPEFAGSETDGVDKKVAPFNNEPCKCEDQLKEGCECGNSECNCDWASKGLPSKAGVGEADTDHNNAPFTNVVNENEDMDVEDEELDVDGEELDDVDLDIEDEEEVEFDEGDFDDMDSEEDEMESDDDILARISELEAELEALKSEVDNEKEAEFDPEMDDDAEMGDDIEMDDDAEMDDEIEIDDDIEMNDEEETEFESDFNDVDDSEFEEDMDECGSLMEAKMSYMNNIVNNVVKNILKEERLNDFGKHPGYKKKPMTLPSTGEDKNQWGEDWNDESVYSELPHGTKVGDGTPFNILVDNITKDVMSTLSGVLKKKVK